MHTRSEEDLLDLEILDGVAGLVARLVAEGEALAKNAGIPAFIIKALHLLDSPLAMKDLGHRLHRQRHDDIGRDRRGHNLNRRYRGKAVDFCSAPTSRSSVRPGLEILGGNIGFTAGNHGFPDSWTAGVPPCRVRGRRSRSLPSALP